MFVGPSARRGGLGYNGSEFRSSAFDDTVRALGASHTFIRAGRPATNGAVERVQRTILEECWRPSFARSLVPKLTGLERGPRRLPAFLQRGTCPHRSTDPGAALRRGVTAAKDNGVGNLRRLGDCEIDRRLDTITRLQSQVANASGLTNADRTTLRSELSTDTTGLTALRGKIDGETDVNALRTDLAKIVTDVRIYLLMVPKTAEVIAADTGLAAVARLGTVNTSLQARIDAAKAAGKDVTQAQADLDAMNAKVAQVAPLVQGLSAAVLPLTPAQYNDGTAKPILTSSRTSLQSGRGLLVEARADARACVAALKAL